MIYGLLADVIVAVHLAYVLYVLLGQVAIVYGGVLRRGWVRNPWFRWSHLLMISIVALEALGDIWCPLTTWEYQLRRLAGQRLNWVDPNVVATSMVLSPVHGGPLNTAALLQWEATAEMTFVGRLLHDVLFLDIPYDHPGFTYTYVTFAAVVILSIVVIPPRRFRRKKDQAEEVPGLVRV